MKVVTVILAALIFILLSCTPSEPCENVNSPSNNSSELGID